MLAVIGEALGCRIAERIRTTAGQGPISSRTAALLSFPKTNGSKVNTDLATVVPTGSGDDGVLLRFNFLGQYVASSGFGGYAGISATTLTFASDSQHEAGTGNFELGSLYQHAMSSELDLGVRVGLILPVVKRDDSLVQLAGTLIARPADIATVFPDATWLRLSISPTYHSGPAFVRADLGVDIAMLDGHGVDPIEHVNVGAGIEHNRVIATAEMQTAFVGPRSIHVACLSARYHGEVASPYVALSTLLEDEFRGEVITVTTGLTLLF